MNRMLWLPFVLAMCVFHSVVYADARAANGFMPARFANTSDSLNAQIQCPNRTNGEDSVVVFCQAAVKEDGTVSRSDSFCFANKRDEEEIAQSTQSTVWNSRFQPASIDGSSIRVYFSFRVLFSYRDQKCTVFAIPNLGYQTESFGIDYFAPQEIRSGLSWLSRAKELRDSTGNLLINKRGIMFVVSIPVSSDGVAGSASLEQNYFGEKGEIRSAKIALQKAKYIPGFVDGKPSDMRYFEILYINPKR